MISRFVGDRVNAIPDWGFDNESVACWASQIPCLINRAETKNHTSHASVAHVASLSGDPTIGAIELEGQFWLMMVSSS